MQGTHACGRSSASLVSYTCGRDDVVIYDTVQAHLRLPSRCIGLVGDPLATHYALSLHALLNEVVVLPVVNISPSIGLSRLFALGVDNVLRIIVVSHGLSEGFVSYSLYCTAV